MQAKTHTCTHTHTHIHTHTNLLKKGGTHDGETKLIRQDSQCTSRGLRWKYLRSATISDKQQSKSYHCRGSQPHQRCPGLWRVEGANPMICGFRPRCHCKFMCIVWYIVVLVRQRRRRSKDVLLEFPSANDVHSIAPPRAPL